MTKSTTLSGTPEQKEWLGIRGTPPVHTTRRTMHLGQDRFAKDVSKEARDRRRQTIAVFTVLDLSNPVNSSHVMHSTTTSARGFNYCDFFTDLCTRIVYPVFTKTRSAAELCQMISLLFNAHPSWKPNGGDSSRLIVIENDTPPTPVAGDRFIRVDAATNYRSTEFQEIAHHFGYRLEHTPPRDKHAGGVAERTVGLITLKANVAMLAPTRPVPISFWDSAVSYACQTQSFSLSSVLGTSPYHFLTKEHVNLKHLQPFWTPCYVHIPTKNGWAKSGYPVLIRPASLATITLI